MIRGRHGKIGDNKVENQVAERTRRLALLESAVQRSGQGGSKAGEAVRYSMSDASGDASAAVSASLLLEAQFALTDQLVLAL